MSDSSDGVDKIVRPGTVGDRIRAIADQLKQETSVQIKATSRILGAAAQISENHDRLIYQVVEMVEEDLEHQAQPSTPPAITVKQIQQQFKTLKDAKSHFGIKANAWASLVDKLNHQVASNSNQDSNQASVSQRLGAIEDEVQAVRTDLNQALRVLDLILEKIS